LQQILTASADPLALAGGLVMKARKSLILHVILVVLCFAGVPAFAARAEPGGSFPHSQWNIDLSSPAAPADSRSARAWRVSFDTAAEPVIAVEAAKFAATAIPVDRAEQRPTAFAYSDAYNTRRKIHLYASYATLPMFVGQYLSGQKLYDGGGSSTARSVHGALVTGMAALFAVNTVTGGWNLLEGRHDPNGRARRWIHGLLMLGADAGFLATGAMAPDDDEVGGANGSLHRNLAIASMSTAAASYLYMLFTR
jgi:hypothetical protein